MRVYCTNPNCPYPEKKLIEELHEINPKEQRYCDRCRTDIILERRYLALEEIGSGGFGKTFRAYDFTFEKECAVKILRPLQRLRPSELQLVEKGFKQGAKILNSLNHQQIPRIHDYFDLNISEQQKFFYLVQEYIPGQTLAQELANKTHKRFSEPEVLEVLRSLLEIIDYTYSQNVIHRDIKPSNIIRHRDNKKLYLIDFDGAIKRELEPGIPVSQSRAMGTPGYAPPEQLSGRNIDISADLYSIAATCVCLLTGKEPAQISNISNPLGENWRIYAPQIESKLAVILDTMLLPFPHQRYKSAREVLEKLDEPSLSPPPTLIPPLTTQSQLPLLTQLTSPFILPNFRRIIRQWRWISLGFLVLLAVAIAIILHFIFNPSLAGYFSRGEEALIAEAQEVSSIPECRAAYDLKKKGMEVFKNASSTADFQQAEKAFLESIYYFQKAIGQTSSNGYTCEIDPETRIYYYNSKAAQTQAINSSLPTIAVVIPDPKKDRGNALEILRGIAQVQSEQESTPVLQILIAKTDSEQKEVQHISQQQIPGELNYFRNSKILGVVGRYTSQNIWQAGDIFGANQLVLISPTSTAIRKSLLNVGQQKPLNEYVFRTASNDSIAAQDLANYIQKNYKDKKVLILFELREIYSESLKDNFVNKLRSLGAKDENIITCSLTNSTSNPQICITTARSEQIQVLMLAPGPNTLDEALNTTKEIKLRNQNQNIQLLGGDVLYDLQTLDLEDAANGMVVAVSSHASLTSSNFIGTATKLWGTRDLSWRTLTSYDAGKAFVKALTDLKSQGNNNPTRQQVYEKLKDPNFVVPGATANIEFNQERDRKQITGVGVLVQATCNPQPYKCYFTPLDIPKRD